MVASQACTSERSENQRHALQFVIVSKSTDELAYKSQDVTAQAEAAKEAAARQAAAAAGPPAAPAHASSSAPPGGPSSDPKSPTATGGTGCAVDTSCRTGSVSSVHCWARAQLRVQALTQTAAPPCITAAPPSAGVQDCNSAVPAHVDYA